MSETLYDNSGIKVLLYLYSILKNTLLTHTHRFIYLYQ